MNGKATTRPVALHPPLPAEVVLTAACRPEIRRGLAAYPLVLLVGRASASNGHQAGDLACSSALNAARALAAREGIRLDHLLPTLRDLKRHHNTTAVKEQMKGLDGHPIDHSWSTWGGPDIGVLLLITTGSGTKVSIDLDQPAATRVADLTRQHQPGVVYARSLHRIGRGGTDKLVTVLQDAMDRRADGPFIGDDNLALSPPTMATEILLSLQSITNKHQAIAIARGNRVGMRARTGLPHPTLPGVWWTGTGATPPPGMTKLRLRNRDGAMPRFALVPDSPASRPPADLIVGGPPPPTAPDGSVADQVELVRWLGAHLYTDGWSARDCAAYLAKNGWAPPGMRRRRKVDDSPGGTGREEPALRLRSNYAGRSDGRYAVRAFLNNLDFYETGELVITIPDGQPPIRLTGVLPADGQPWITPTQAHRIRTAVARRQSGPRRKHLFTGLCVRVDGQLAQLHPRQRRSGDLAYVFKRADNARQALNPRGTGLLRPLPATVLARWYAEALAGLAMPLSLRLADKPRPADSTGARIDILQAEVTRLEAAQDARWQEIDPGADQFNPVYAARLKQVWEEAERDLQDKRAALQAAQRQHAREQRSPVTPGAPLARLVELAAALPQPYDTGHRLLLRELTAGLTITTRRRPTIGGLTAYEVHAQLTLQITDGQHTWEATSSHTWTQEAEHRTVGRLMPAVDALYDGTTLRESLGSDWLTWVPAARQALGCPGTFAFAYARDARLLRLQMAVMYPRDRAPGTQGQPGRRTVAPARPVPVDALPALAAHLGEPVALLEAIHRTWSTPSAKRWAHNASPAVAAAYARAAAHGGTVPRNSIPTILSPTLRSRPDSHRLASEWSEAGSGQVALQPCADCGSVRRSVMLVREVTGSLCLDCRRDRAGVLWDSSYDRFTDRHP